MNYYSLFLTSIQFLQKKILRYNNETKKTHQEFSKKQINDILHPESFPPTEEIQKHKQLLDFLKPYHNNEKDILITIADLLNTLEQARDLLQNIAFETTRVSQSVPCMRTSLDEVNYTFERLQQS